MVLRKSWMLLFCNQTYVVFFLLFDCTFMFVSLLSSVNFISLIGSFVGGKVLMFVFHNLRFYHLNSMKLLWTMAMKIITFFISEIKLIQI